MANTGAITPATVSDLSNVWSNDDNARVEDGSVAFTLVNIGNQATGYLQFTQFGFSLPPGAAIDGVVAECKAKYTNAPTNTAYVQGQLVKAGVTTGDLKDFTPILTGSLAWDSYGSSSNVWNATLSAADVNASGFGINIRIIEFGSVTDFPGIDSCRMTIYYTFTPIPRSQGFIIAP